MLDIGCHQGEFLYSLGEHIGPSVGIDPRAAPRTASRYRLVTEAFREPAPFAGDSFDVIVLLATLEHIEDKEAVARECYRVLRPAGRVILTVPSPRVDVLVSLLRRLRLADGMSLGQHHGFEPSRTPKIFGPWGLTLVHRATFQLRVNHLFVFRKRAPGCLNPWGSSSVGRDSLWSRLPRSGPLT